MPRWILVMLLACVFGTPALAGDTPPALPAETLDGSALTLPQALPAQPVLLIVGFSRASRGACRSWSERLHRADHPAGLAVYQVAAIDDVPRWLRGLVARGIRSGVPAALHDHFLLVTAQGAIWRKFAGYAQPDAAYLLLFDARHELRWRHTGALDTAAYVALQRAVRRLGGSR
ncbi:MAG: hypothetical protein EPN68_06610 [Rhodanobacter sp.]|nr:MAG: hypothetical protein EPN68_06610 [Rhodanobacter sp.]